MRRMWTQYRNILSKHPKGYVRCLFTISQSASAEGLILSIGSEPIQARTYEGQQAMRVSVTVPMISTLPDAEIHPEGQMDAGE